MSKRTDPLCAGRQPGHSKCQQQTIFDRIQYKRFSLKTSFGVTCRFTSGCESSTEAVNPLPPSAGGDIVANRAVSQPGVGIETVKLQHFHHHKGSLMSPSHI